MAEPTDALPEDPLVFNVRADDGSLLCPCCGLSKQFLEEAYGPAGGIIGTGICACCCWEPGFDDDPAASAAALPTIMASLHAYRRRWLDSGLPWDGVNQGQQPVGWDGRTQLHALLTIAPHLAGVS